MSSDAPRPAVFVDRDNTLIDDPGYLCDPQQVRLRDGTAEAISRLRQAGYPVIVVTNQSGVARGLLSEGQLADVHQRMQDLLLAKGTGVDAIYHCPYLDGPEAVREAYRRDSDLRKPKPGMLHLAAEEMNVDLPASWMVGDSERDVEAGHAAGCRTIRLSSKSASPGGAGGGPSSAAEPSTTPDFVVPNLAAAVDVVLGTGEPAGPPAGQTTEHAGNQQGSKDSSGPKDPSGSASGPFDPLILEPSNPSGDTGQLGQILEELRTIRRDRQHDDFSIGKLAGAVAQAFALCAIGWGLYAWANTTADPQHAPTTATISLLAGIAFQVMALTFFAAANKK